MKLKFHIPQSEINGLIVSTRKWAAEIEAQIVVLIDETTEKIFQEARARAPVDTGTLRDSIRRSMIEEIIKNRFADVTVGAFYARFIEIEYGGVKRPATPFLRPAYEKHIPDFIRGLKKIIREA